MTEASPLHSALSLIFLPSSHEEPAPFLQPCGGRESAHLQLLSCPPRQPRHLRADLLLRLMDRNEKTETDSVSSGFVARLVTKADDSVTYSDEMQ